MELRWIRGALGARRGLEEARQDVATWLGRRAKRYRKLCRWVEENIGETLSFHRLPRQHHRHLRSSNVLERLIEELKPQRLAVRISPNAAACLRLIRALAVEMHESRIEATRYRSMEPLAEQKKEVLRRLGEAA